MGIYQLLKNRKKDPATWDHAWSPPFGISGGDAGCGASIEIAAPFSMDSGVLVPFSVGSVGSMND